MTRRWNSKLRMFSSGALTCRRERRRGVTIVELISTMIMVSIVFSVSASLIYMVARERRSSEQRQVALQHAANLLERTTAMGWKGLELGVQSIDPAPADLQSLLPHLNRRVEVASLPQELHSKLVTVAYSWRNSAGQTITPVRLSAWVYPLEETAR